MKTREELSLFFKKTLIFFLTAILVGLTLWSRQIILSVILGVGIATILTPITIGIKNKIKVNNTIATIMIYIILLLVIASVTFSLSWLTSQQLTELWQKLPELITEFSSYINSKIYKLIGNSAKLKDLDMGINIEEIVSSSMSTLKLSFDAISGIALSAIISFYICANPKFYQKQLFIMVDDKNKEKYLNAFQGSASTLRSWFTAQLVDMFIIGVLTTIGLFLVGFQYWIAIGLLTGVLAIIPYFGVLTVALVSILITLANSPENVYWVVAVFVVTQQLEGGVILPLLMKKKVSLPEVPLIIFIVLMGFWFGLLGMLMAPPILAVGLYLINHFKGSKPDILITN